MVTTSKFSRALVQHALEETGAAAVGRSTSGSAEVIQRLNDKNSGYITKTSAAIFFRANSLGST